MVLVLLPGTLYRGLGPSVSARPCDSSSVILCYAGAADTWLKRYVYEDVGVGAGVGDTDVYDGCGVLRWDLAGGGERESILDGIAGLSGRWEGQTCISTI